MGRLGVGIRKTQLQKRKRVASGTKKSRCEQVVGEVAGGCCDSAAVCWADAENEPNRRGVTGMANDN